MPAHPRQGSVECLADVIVEGHSQRPLYGRRDPRTL
jgi:hypothetical protein